MDIRLASTAVILLPRGKSDWSPDKESAERLRTEPELWSNHAWTFLSSMSHYSSFTVEAILIWVLRHLQSKAFIILFTAEHLIHPFPKLLFPKSSSSQRPSCSSQMLKFHIRFFFPPHLMYLTFRHYLSSSLSHCVLSPVPLQQHTILLSFCFYYFPLSIHPPKNIIRLYYSPFEIFQWLFMTLRIKPILFITTYNILHEFVSACLTFCISYHSSPGLLLSKHIGLLSVPLIGCFQL